MKRSLMISVAIIILTISPVVVLASAGGQRPEKLSIDDVSWNAEAQSFEIEGTVQFGIAEAAENTYFAIAITLVVDGGPSSYTTTNVQEMETDEADLTKNSVIIFQIIPWNRILDNGELFDGPADVTVEAKILNPAGNFIAVAEPLTVEGIEIVPPLECQIDSDCGVGEICLNGLCMLPEPICSSDKDCVPGTICNIFSGVCVEEIACESDASCPERFICEANRCLPDLFCTSVNDCPPLPGYECINFRCTAP